MQQHSIIALIAVAAILIVVAASSSHAANPGATVSVTQAGITYAKDIGMQVVLAKLAHVAIPDVSGSTHVDVLGDIDYTLSNIDVHSLTVASEAVTIESATTIRVNINQAAAVVTLDWDYREHHWPHVKGHGSADVEVQSLTAVVDIAVSDNGGRAGFSVSACSVSIGSIDVHVSGGPSWLYNFLIGIFKSKIKDAATSALQDAITKAVDDSLNAAIANVPIQVKIADVALLDYSLTSAPVFVANSYLDVPVLAEFFSLDHTEPFPGVPVALPAPDTTSMVQVAVSDFTVNSASYVFSRAGKLNVTVLPSEVPSWSPIKLNTSSFEYIVPQLYSHYPNKAMELQLSPASAPVISFETAGPVFSAVMHVRVMALMDAANPASAVEAFVVAVTVHGALTVSLVDMNLAGKITSFNGTVSLVNSDIGSIDVTLLGDAIQLMLQDGVLPYLNTALATGFPLPAVKCIKLTSPSFKFGSGFMLLETDVAYDATSC